VFTTHFSAKQKAVFLDLLDKLVAADGQVTSVEQAKLDEYHNLYSPIRPEAVSPETLIEVFANKKDRSAVLLELLAVGMMKSPVHVCNEADDKHLKELSKCLSISDYDLGWMTMWVSQLLLLLKEVNKVMAAD
jgi:hypothetical protein